MTGKGKSKAEESIGDSEKFYERSRQLLEAYDNQRALIESEMQGKAKATITRKLTPHRSLLREELLKVAVEERCLSGKASATDYMI